MRLQSHQVHLTSLQYCKTLNFGHLNFGVWVNYFGPRNFSVFASHYTETTVFKFLQPVVFANLPGSRNKGHVEKNGFYSWDNVNKIKSTITAIHFTALLICQKQVKRLLLANESCTRFITAIVRNARKKARVNVKLVAYWNQSTNKTVHHVYTHLEHQQRSTAITLSKGPLTITSIYHMVLLSDSVPTQKVTKKTWISWAIFIAIHVLLPNACTYAKTDMVILRVSTFIFIAQLFLAL